MNRSSVKLWADTFYDVYVAYITVGIDGKGVWHFAFFRNIRIFVFRGLKEDVSLFEVEGFSLMTLVTIME